MPKRYMYGKVYYTSIVNMRAFLKLVSEDIESFQDFNKCLVQNARMDPYFILLRTEEVVFGITSLLLDDISR